MKEEEMKHGTLAECLLCARYNPESGFCQYRTLGSGSGCKGFREIDKHNLVYSSTMEILNDK